MHYYLFWLKSSRGANYKVCLPFKKPLSKETAREILEDWCSQHGCWEASESFCTFGWKKVKTPLKELKARFKKIAVRRAKLNEQYEELRAIVGYVADHRWRHYVS